MINTVRVPLEWMRTILVESVFDEKKTQWDFETVHGNKLRAIRFCQADSSGIYSVIEFEWNPDDKD